MRYHGEKEGVAQTNCLVSPHHSLRTGDVTNTNDMEAKIFLTRILS